MPLAIADETMLRAVECDCDTDPTRKRAARVLSSLTLRVSGRRLALGIEPNSGRRAVPRPPDRGPCWAKVDRPTRP